MLQSNYLIINYLLLVYCILYKYVWKIILYTVTHLYWPDKKKVKYFDQKTMTSNLCGIPYLYTQVCIPMYTCIPTYFRLVFNLLDISPYTISILCFRYIEKMCIISQ